MDLFDLALQFRDFVWAEELLQKMQHKDDARDERDTPVAFTQEAIALDDLVTECAVIEKDGIRQFNIFSDFDRSEAEIVIIENPPYTSGESVKYYIPSEKEKEYMKATADGYLLGYRDALHMVNTNYPIFEEEMKKKKTGNAKSSNVKKNNTKNSNARKSSAKNNGTKNKEIKSIQPNSSNTKNINSKNKNSKKNKEQEQKDGTINS